MPELELPSQVLFSRVTLSADPPEDMSMPWPELLEHVLFLRVALSRVVEE